MTAESLALFVTTYDDATSALADYQRLEIAERCGQAVDEGAVVLSRIEDGRVVDATSGEGLFCAGLLSCRDTALVVGLFIPPLLLSRAALAGTDPGFAELVKKHDQGKMGVAVRDYLSNGSSAIAVLLELQYVSGVAQALSGGDVSISTLIDWDDYWTIDQVLSGTKIGTARACDLDTCKFSGSTSTIRSRHS
jgi:hypothetical protein